MNFAEQLKNQLNIVDVVQQYVPLKRQGSGQRWIGLCPFHSEKTPSFGVHSGHQYYKCFGCDAGGDVFNFIQQIESLTFAETLRLLAERYSIPMPERQRNDDPQAQHYAALLEIHEAAAALFQENFRGPSGAEARAYLESRGVSSDAVREFRLGLADASGQQLAHRLRSFGENLLLDAGLIARRQDAPGVYDRFRGRLMFPIHNGSGKVIAFGGRTLLADDKVKYLNSPETKLYTKSSILYNLHRAKIAARKNDRIIIVEGYMDAIGIYSSGIQEVVALCGTALGPNQIRAMKQETSYQSGHGHVILNFDSDSAGNRSTEKYIPQLLASGLRVKVLNIPGDLDPDEFIQKNGAAAYYKLLENAPSYFHWLADNARTKFNLRTAEGRVDAFKFILPAVEHVHDRIERSAIAAEVAERLGVDRDIVRQVLRPKTSSQGTARNRDFAAGIPANEKLLIACMLASADARKVVRHFFSEAGTLEILELKTIFEAIFSASPDDAVVSLAAIVASLDSRSQRILSEISFSESGIPEEHAAEQALDCLKRLEEKSFQKKCEHLKKLVREADARGDLNEAFRLTEELDGLTRLSGKRE
jgi:DNA primase